MCYEGQYYDWVSRSHPKFSWAHTEGFPCIPDSLEYFNILGIFYIDLAQLYEPDTNYNQYCTVLDHGRHIAYFHVYSVSVFINKLALKKINPKKDVLIIYTESVCVPLLFNQLAWKK